MSINPHADRSFYKQLADIFRDLILSGALPPGANLPSENRASREYQVGREVVRQAVAILRAEGLVDTARGGGTCVRVPAPRAAVVLRPGDRVTARMPYDPERRRDDIGEGVPLLEVRHANGTCDRYPADGFEITSG